MARTPLATSSIPVVPVDFNSTLNGGEEGRRRGGEGSDIRWPQTPRRMVMRSIVSFIYLRGKEEREGGREER